MRKRYLMLILSSIILGGWIVVIHTSILHAATLNWDYNKANYERVLGWKLYWSDTAGGPYKEVVDIKKANVSTDETQNSAIIQLTVSGQLGTDVTKYFVLTAYETKRKYIVLDDGDAGTSSIGNWQASEISGGYEDDSMFSKDADAQYIYQIPYEGKARAGITFVPHEKRCKDVMIYLFDDTSLLRKFIGDYTRTESGWWSLGEYNFTGTAVIKVEKQGTSDCSISADAVGLMYLVDGEIAESEYSNETSATFSIPFPIIPPIDSKVKIPVNVKININTVDESSN